MASLARTAEPRRIPDFTDVRLLYPLLSTFEWTEPLAMLKSLRFLLVFCLISMFSKTWAQSAKLQDWAAVATGLTWVNPPADTAIYCGQFLPDTAVFFAASSCDPDNPQLLEADFQGLYEVENSSEACSTLFYIWEVGDTCGGGIEHIQTITVLDTIAPVWIEYNPYLMVECSDILTQEQAEDPANIPLYAIDNCSPELDYVIEVTELTGGCPRTWMRSWTAFDACGNPSVTTMQYLQLFDETDPLLLVPNDTIIYLDAECAAPTDTGLLGAAIPLDECSAHELLLTNLNFEDEWSSSICAGDDSAAEGSYTVFRTWSTTDYCLNSGSGTQTITVLDTIAPVGFVEDVVIECADYDEVTEFGVASGTDNCDSDVSYSWTTVTGRMDADDEEAPGCYYYDREYTFVDDCGNSSTEMQRIYLVDNEPPTFDGDFEILLECDLFQEDVNFGGVLGLNNIQDNCTSPDDINVSWVDQFVSGSCAGSVFRTYALTDNCGNTALFVQIVNSFDEEDPTFTITCPQDVQVQSDAYCTVDIDPSITGAPIVYGLEDNCDDQPNLAIFYDDTTITGACSGEFTIERSWAIYGVDHCDNFSEQTCTQVISVVDEQPPAAPGLLCPSDIILNSDTSLSDFSPSLLGYPEHVTLDNCSDSLTPFVDWTDDIILLDTAESSGLQINRLWEVYYADCTNVAYCNYNPLATVDDGSCESISCAGCLNETACNYDSTAIFSDPGSCTFPIDLYGVDFVDCDGNCLGQGTDGGGAQETLGGYGIEVEVVASDIGELISAVGTIDLSGYSTYRAYITMENEDDFLSAVSGDASFPSSVTTTADFFHSALGGPTPNGINSLLFPVFPDLEYDSWVTIGLEGAANAALGEASITIGQSSANPWIDVFDSGDGTPGSSIMIDDFFGGYWFALNGDANGIAGEDLRVLVGQFTTTGVLEMSLYTQIFIEGEGTNPVVNDEGNLPTFTWSSGLTLSGCTDDAACNFEACANTDDGSCLYPQDLYGSPFVDCEGLCINDADGDGICDDDEPCTDPNACDYDGGEPELAPYCLMLDTVAQHDSGPLAGMTTYRLSLKCENPGDFVSAVAGYAAHPLQILTTTAFYQDALGGPTPNGIAPALFANFPELEYDSWVTIGLEQSPDIISGEAEINTIQGGENTWLSDFDPGGGVPGSSIVMDDPVGGSWFVLIGDSNGYANGPEQEVLLAQLTTDGMLSGALYIQVFVEGDGGNIEYLTLEIGGNCYPTDEDCTYPEDLYGADYLDCSGFCLNDTDGDGICDEAEVPGCTDEEACNFNPDATDEDGGCSYLEMFTETFDVSCFGAADGRLILDIQGGIAPFALSISGYPTVTLDTAYFIFEGVPPGSYTVQLSDAAECATPEFGIQLEEPEPLEFEFDFVDECATPQGQGVDFFASGGTPPYVFQASGETVLTSLDGLSGTDLGSAFHAFLPPGLWVPGVMDASGCLTQGDSISVVPCVGCTDPAACNFDGDASEDDGSCTYPPEVYYDCDGNCINDSDGDGICDEAEIPGCTWPYACNFDPDATDEDFSCYMGSVFFDCYGNCILDMNDNGLCDFFENLTDGTNFCGPGTVWDPAAGNCIGIDDCPSDVDGNGYIGMNDLLDLLGNMTYFCE